MKKNIVMILCVLFLLSCGKSETLTRTDFVLGTVVEISLRDHGSDELIEKLFERLREIECHMSFSMEQSDIFHLNHAEGEVTSLHDDTYQVLTRALAFYKESGGYFEPSLGGVVDLWKIGTEEARVPSDEEIREALSVVDASKIELRGDHQVRIPEGMAIDLGAIAKGYAADEMARMAKEAGVKSALFNLGGNVLLLGQKEGKPFQIGIQTPEPGAEGHYVGILSLSDQTIVTSGDYERFFLAKDGTRYHHILDFRTGYPVQNELAAVSVIADSSIDADALSTTLYAMGLKEGWRFVEAREGLEAIFITRDKEIIITPGLLDKFQLKDTSYHVKQAPK